MRRCLTLLSLCTLLAVSTAAFSRPVAALDSANAGIVVQSIKGPTVEEKLVTRAKTSWAWYVTRGTGIVAAIALIILMLSGIGQITGYTFRFLDPLTAWASHRALGIVFGVAILIHMISLLFDRFVPFSVWQILIPWLSTYKPVSLFGHNVGSLYVALGVLAFYASFLVILTSLFWVEKKPYLWKLIHIFSYLIIAMVFVHALYIGTDLADGFLRLVWLGLGALIAISVLHRLWSVRTI